MSPRAGDSQPRRYLTDRPPLADVEHQRGPLEQLTIFDLAEIIDAVKRAVPAEAATVAKGTA